MENEAMKEVWIRRMAMRDLEDVTALEKEIFSEPWTQRGFSDALMNKQTLFLVAQDPGGSILGYCGLYFSGDEGEITNVAVDAANRRRGIGRAMLEGLMKEAKQRGITRLFLEVRVSNEEAIRLYERFGFVFCGMRKDFYCLPAEDALCYCCELK